MKRNLFDLAFLLLAAMAILLAGCQTVRPTPIDEPSTQEGLTRVENKAVDAVYRRPDASLSGYSKLLLHPVEVQFAKNWDPDSGGSGLYGMNKPDVEKIKRDLADLFVEAFKRNLEKGGYPLVDQPGKDVLEMRAALVNVYITAPDVSMQTTSRVRVYTTEAGEMTLVMQLHDSVTGQLLVRAYDRESDNGTGNWTWTNSVSNSAEARSIISGWATTLRKAFDAVRAPTEVTAHDD